MFDVGHGDVRAVPRPHIILIIHYPYTDHSYKYSLLFYMIQFEIYQLDDCFYSYPSSFSKISASAAHGGLRRAVPLTVAVAHRGDHRVIAVELHEPHAILAAGAVHARVVREGHVLHGHAVAIQRGARGAAVEAFAIDHGGLTIIAALANHISHENSKIVAKTV